MAEEDRKGSGCGLMVLYNGLFRRTSSCTTRRTSSAGSISGTSADTISTTPTPVANSKRRRSDEAALVLSSPIVGPRKPQQKQLPVVPVRPVVHPKSQVTSYNKSNGGMGQSKAVGPGTGLSAELNGMMYDRQRAKGNDTLVRASSSNVMLFGDLGNLCTGNASRSNTDVLDFLPPTAKEVANASQANGRGGRSNDRESAPATTSAPALPAPSLCRALSKRMEPEELKEMGNKEYKNGRYVEALVYYDRAIAIDPKKASYWSNKAAALISLGRFLEAVVGCREAIKIDPSYKRAHHRLAGLYLRLGEAEKAVYHYKQAGNETGSKDMARAQSTQIHINKCNEARKFKNWLVVLKEAEMAISSGADSAPRVFVMQAEALVKLQRHQEADMVLIDSPTFEIDESTKFFGVSSNAYMLSIRAQIDMSVGRFNEAVSTAQKAVRIDPSNTEAAAIMRRARIVVSARSKGNELFKASRFSEACLAYGEGLDHDSHNSVLLCNRAACKMKLAQWEKAVDDCTKALNVRPSYSKARLRRADCYTMLEKWEKALQDYEVLTEDMPGDQEVRKALAKVQLQLKKDTGEDVDDAKVEDGISVITTDDQFKRIVDSTGTSVILFYDKSSEGEQILPFMDQLRQKYPSVKFAKVDMEESADLAETDEVSTIPSFRIYKNCSKFEDIEGSDWDALERCIKNFNS